MIHWDSVLYALAWAALSSTQVKKGRKYASFYQAIGANNFSQHLENIHVVCGGACILLHQAASLPVPILKPVFISAHLHGDVVDGIRISMDELITRMGALELSLHKWVFSWCFYSLVLLKIAFTARLIFALPLAVEDWLTIVIESGQVKFTPRMSAGPKI